MKKARSWFAVLLVVATAGCATQSGTHQPRLTGDPLVDGPAAIASGPAKDRVVWDYRMAAAAMRRSQFDEARRSLDDALPRIGGILANDSDARKARSLFHSEARKVFIGEPYERVMAYYYRGILYWMSGEADNARACFRSAQFQDADTENKTYAADYVLLDYLDGYVTTRMGGDGSDEFKRALANAKGSRPPPYYRKANVMLFLEFGYGPQKYATGSYKEELRFRPGPVSARQVTLHVGTQSFVLVPYDDLLFQATTRGGRVMDHILANKAVFKTTTGAVGAAGLITGVALAANGNNTGAAIAGGIGLLSTIVSAATTPSADVRMWDNLPQYLTFASLELPPGPHEITVDFQEQPGRTVVTKKVSFNVLPPPRDTVLFVSQLNN